MKRLKTSHSGITNWDNTTETSDSNNEDTVLSSIRANPTTASVSNVRIIQNFRLIWLDSSIDEVNNDDSINIITKLREVVNAVQTFTAVDECINFITDIEKEKIFLICSGEIGETIISIVYDMSQINCIFIFCKDKARHEQWVKKWPKIKGVFTDIIPICEALKHVARDCDRNSVSISFIKMVDEASNQNLDTLDQSFMYTQLLKEILFTIDFKQEHMNEFLMYCREQFVGNNAELKNVDMVEKEYYNHKPIWWYTCQYFLYSMLNRALRLMEVDLIIKMGFFIRDLHNHIAALHTEQYTGQNHSNTFTVYRGQGLSLTDFDQLMKGKTGLMSFNNFLSTSVDRAVSFAFAESSQSNPDLIGVLFEITINPSLSTTPFANVKNISNYQEEEEILFSMHSIFRIEQMKQIDENTRLWQVDLTLTSDNDPELHTLTEIMRDETFPTLKGWYRLGHLLIKLGQFDKAQQVFDIMLDQTTDEEEKSDIYQAVGTVNYNQGKYPEAADFYEKSIKLYQKNLPPTHSDLSSLYNNLGSVYNNMGEYSKAVSYYEKALEINEKDPSSIPSDLAILCSNLGSVYNNMGDHTKALSYHEKALEILQKTLPANHPSLATSYNNIGLVYCSMSKYSKALSSYEKALKIYHKTLPANHPHWAYSYNNMGLMYDKMGEHSKALSYHEKALEIYQKTLPENHPELATSYSNIGTVYCKMGDHSKTLTYFEKAIEIEKQTLPENHPSLATSYNNIAFQYVNTGEYTKALSYFERAMDIFQHSLPPEHPSISTVKESIEIVKKKM